MSNEIKPIAINGHTKPVTMVKFNADGDLLFSTGKDGKVAVHRSKDGERIGVYQGHSAVAGCDVNRSSTLLATAGNDLKTNLWAVESGERPLATIEHLAPCRSVGISHDDRTLFCNTDKRMGQVGAIHFFNIPETMVLGGVVKTKFNSRWTFESPVREEAITFAEWGPTSSHVFYTTSAGGLAILDVEAQKVVRSVKRHSPDHDIVKLHFDSQYYTCITASKDTTAKLFDTRDLSVISTYQTELPVNDAVISPLADHILLGGGVDAQDVTTSSTGGFSLRFFHKVHEDLLGVITGAHFGTINTVAFHPNGKTFASGAVDGYVKIFNLGEGYGSAPGARCMWQPRDEEDEDGAAAAEVEDAPAGGDDDAEGEYDEEAGGAEEGAAEEEEEGEAAADE